MMRFLRNLVSRVVTWAKYALAAWQMGQKILDMVRRLRARADAMPATQTSMQPAMQPAAQPAVQPTM